METILAAIFIAGFFGMFGWMARMRWTEKKERKGR